MDKDPMFAHGQDIRDRTFAFACRVIKFCEQTYAAGGVARLVAPQLLSCSTSVAAMLEEARAGESDRDFISKCSVGLKEAREAHVRLRLHDACRIGSTAEEAALGGRSQCSRVDHRDHRSKQAGELQAQAPWTSQALLREGYS
jgi:four helix bundle protein